MRRKTSSILKYSSYNILTNVNLTIKKKVSFNN